MSLQLIFSLHYVHVIGFLLSETCYYTFDYTYVDTYYYTFHYTYVDTVQTKEMTLCNYEIKDYDIIKSYYVTKI